MTTTDAQIEIGMPLEEYIERSEREGLFEIIDGREIIVSPVVRKHNRVGKRLLFALEPFKNEGEVMYDTPYILEAKRNWVKGARVPDLMYYTAERLAAHDASVADYDDKPVILVPDMTVEIISPTDKRKHVLAKVRMYHDDGVGVVWLIDTDYGSVTVMPRGDKAVLLHNPADLLSGGDLLPGFSVTLAELFA